MARKPVRRSATRESSGNRQTYILLGGLGVVVAIGLIVLLAISLSPGEQLQGVITYPAAVSGEHSSTLRYDFEALPQHGGPHSPAWQNCGIYDEPVRPEHVIHSLEHGALWVTYQESMAPDDVATLQDMFAGEPFVILSPYPNQRSPIVMTTWIYQIEIDDVADDRVEAFAARYKLDPATTPELGGACSGQVGSPLIAAQ